MMKSEGKLMHADMVYEFPMWQVGALVMVGAICGAILVEVVTRRFLSAAFRRQHNDVAAAMFSIIG